MGYKIKNSSMRIVMMLIVFACACHAANHARSEPPDRALAPMPIYVTPYYNSQGPKIDVGPFSKELTEATAATISALAAKMKQQWDTLPVETMYVLAIRLYDLGLKDDAVYWFYSAQWRGFLYRDTIPPEAVGGIAAPAFEHLQANKAFHKLAGTHINGYAFGDLPKLQKTLETVKAESAKLPKLAAIYPGQKFLPEEAWPTKNEKIAAAFDEMLQYIIKNPEAIQALRKQNGVEEK